MDVDYTLCQNRARQIGLIVLQADETIERDMRRLLPDTLEMLVSRVPSGTHVTRESLATMESELARSAALFPTAAKFAAVGYGCTSGSAEIGAKAVADAIMAATATAHVTDPVTALIAACRHLDVTRMGLLSPYIESVSTRLREVLGAAGIEVCAFASFNESEEGRVVRIAPQSIIAAADKLSAQAQMDAMFLSCTNLRTLEVIETIEAKTRMPILTSNQVLAWHLVQLAGINAAHENAGMLWNRDAQVSL